LGDVSHLQDSTIKVSTSMAGLGSKFALMGGALALGVGGAAAALGAFGLKAIQASADMEQTRIAFGTLLGGAKQADSMIRDLQAFAAKTPFEFSGLQQSAKRLLAFGFTAKSIIPTMTAVGDAVAALGGGQEMIDRVTMAMGQMMAKGRVQGDEMLQLAEAGIPAWDFLAKKLGVTIPEAMKKVTAGAVDAKTGIDALTEGMEQRFGGLMTQQSGTITGLFSNLQDSVGQTMVSVGDSLTKGLDVKGKLQGVLDLMSKLQGFVQGKVTLGEIVGPDAAAALGRVHDTLNEIGAAIGQIAEKVKPFGENLARLAIPHLDVLVIAGLAAAFGLLAIAAGAAAVAVIAATWPVLAIIAAIALLAAGVYLVITNWAQITAFLGGLWAGISAWFASLGAAVEAAWSAFASRPGYYIGVMVGFVIGKLAELILGASIIFNRILGVVMGWAAQLPGLALQGAIALSRAFSDEVGRLPGQMVDIGVRVVTGIYSGFMSMTGWLRSQINGFVGGLVDGAKAALGIGSPSRVFAEQVGAPIAQGVAQGIERAAAGARRAMGGMLDATITAGGSLAGGSLAVAPAGGASVIYNVTVNASPLSSPADVGRAVVQAIQEYERRSGPAWRT
jgi:tape measure domain-containing protein